MPELSALAAPTTSSWVITAGVALALVWIYKNIFVDKSTTPISKDGKPIPPLIPCGFIKTIKAITGSRKPWFILENCRRFDESIYRYHVTPYGLGAPLSVVIGNAKLAQEVLKDPKSYKPKRVYERFEKLIDAPSSFTTEGHRWQHSRKAIALAFASKHITRMNDVVHKQINAWITETFIPKYVEKGQPFDVAHEFLRQILKGVSLAGFDYNLSDKEVNMFISDVNIILKEGLAQSVNPVRKALSPFISAARRLPVAKERLRQFSQNLLDNYRSMEDPQDETIISMIVKNESYESDEERIADISIIFFASYDTTAYSLIWTLLELAKNPTEQTKLRNSLRDVSGDERRNVPELRCVVKEGMRLHPVVAAGVCRELGRDYTTEKYFIPKGTIAAIATIAIHRNPKYFEEPDEFRPSRWMNPSEEASMAFIPFVLGRHNCVGQSLANAELFTILSTLISGFEFSVFDEGETDFFVTLKPVGAKLIARKV